MKNNKILIIFISILIIILQQTLIYNLEKNIFTTYTREQIYNYAQKKIEEKNFNDGKDCIEFLLNGEQSKEKTMKLSIEFGTTLYKLKKYNDAENVFTFFIDDNDFINNATNEQKEHAYYMCIKCIFKLQKDTFLKKLMFTFTDKRTRDIQKMKKALKLLKKIKNEYPNSSHLKYVKKHIKIVKDHINFHKLHIIKYYKNIGNYKAAYERLKKIKIKKKNKLTNEEKLLENELLKK